MRLRIKKNVVEISSTSFKIRGTYNHRVKVYGGKGGLQWKKLKDITTDDFVAIPLKHDILFDNKSKTFLSLHAIIYFSFTFPDLNMT